MSDNKHVTKANLAYYHQHGVVPVKELAESRARAMVYADYSAMLDEVVALSATDLKAGDALYVRALAVPDVYVGEVLTSAAQYTYTDDADVVLQLTSSTGLAVGYYRLFAVETKPVEPGSGEENYIKNIQITEENTDNGVASVTVDANGNLVVRRASFLTALDLVTPDETGDARGGAMSQADKWKLDQLRIFEPLTDADIDAIISPATGDN